MNDPGSTFSQSPNTLASDAQSVPTALAHCDAVVGEAVVGGGTVGTAVGAEVQPPHVRGQTVAITALQPNDSTVGMQLASSGGASHTDVGALVGAAVVGVSVVGTPVGAGVANSWVEVAISAAVSLCTSTAVTRGLCIVAGLYALGSTVTVTTPSPLNVYSSGPATTRSPNCVVAISRISNPPVPPTVDALTRRTTANGVLGMSIPTSMAK